MSDTASITEYPPIRTEAEYVRYLREVSYLWDSHEPGAVERIEAYIRRIEEYEAGNPAGITR